jgi:integrase
LICCVEDGSIWVPSAFTSAYRALLDRRKLKGPNFHALRHAHASQLLREGVDLKVISKRLGHSRASFTMDVYAHLMPGQDEEAAGRLEKLYRKAMEGTTGHA